MEPVLELLFAIELALSDDGATKDIESALSTLKDLVTTLENKHAELSDYEN
jgi:hypothetical protein